MKLNTEEWKEFRIGDWFDGESGDFDIKLEHINGNGVIVITSGLEDCGILGKTDVDARIIDKNTITIDMFGNAFYRSYKYKMVTHARVFALKPKFNMTSRVGLFISTVLFFLKDKYSYSHMCSYNKIKHKKIKLPSKNNEPDWKFMKEYIKEIEKKYIDKVDEYNQKNIKKALDITGITKDELDKDLVIEPADRYEGFKVGDLFDSVKIKGINNDSLNKNYDTGIYRYITRTSLNYGISDMTGEINGVKLQNANTFSLGLLNMDFFFQPEQWYAGQFVRCIVPKFEINDILAIYFQTIFNKRKDIYKQVLVRDFDKVFLNDVLKLPAIDEKTPDFNYMERYIYIYTKKVIKSWQMDNEQEINALKTVISK